MATEESIKDIESMNREDALTILGHMVELRDRLIRAVLALVIATLLAFLFTEPLLEFLIEPMGVSSPYSFVLPKCSSPTSKYLLSQAL